MTVLSMSKLTASCSSGASSATRCAHVGARALHRGLHVGQPLGAASAPSASRRRARRRPAPRRRPPRPRPGPSASDEGEEQSEKPRHAITVTGALEAHPSNSSTHAGHELAGRAVPGLVEEVAAVARDQVELEGAGAVRRRRLHEAGRRVDRARGADRDEQVGLLERGEDPVHLVGDLAEPDHVGAQLHLVARGARREVAQVALPLDAGRRTRGTARSAARRACAARAWTRRARAGRRCSG